MTKHTQLDPVLAPLSSARGLPNAHYVSPEVFTEEREALLFSSWAGIGFDRDAPEPGDVFPVSFLGVPLLIARDKAGDLHVFQNTCRHRGMILVEQPGKIEGALRCPYHSWCYDLTGRLRATPHVGGAGQNTHPEMDRDQLGLVEFRSHIWQGVVFVNISGDAPEFEITHANLLDRWQDFDRPLHHGGPESVFELEVGCNWKLAVENYCESYHLPWVHPGLNSYSRLEDHYNIIESGQYSGQGTTVYRQLKGADGVMFPDFKDISDNWDTGAEYIALYPNVLFGVHRDHVYAILLIPRGPDETLERVALSYAASDTSETLRCDNAVLWKGVFEEDIFVVEGMQRGRHGVQFDGGRFSPAMDGPTHAFHQWVASRVQAARTP